jgi:hypothetical protein
MSQWSTAVKVHNSLPRGGVHGDTAKVLIDNKHYRQACSVQATNICTHVLHSLELEHSSMHVIHERAYMLQKVRC